MMRLPALLAAALLALGACTNDPERSSALDTARGIAAGLAPGGGTPAATSLTPQEVAATLASTPNPLVLVRVEASQSEAIFGRIELNGGHGTYATANREAFIFRSGLITGTRGLGGDLMSSQSAAMEAAVLRGGGSVPYAMEFIDGENRAAILTFTCDVQPGGTVTVSCTGSQGYSFRNTFITGPGQVSAGRQWLGPVLGYATFTHLRQ